ncbi:hypothetical protein CONLIGDRAFT_276364 [Coniochaeta ligniaria NRRL 30616]|uniref:Uncharacterized protein n=1 Tax=Coniochaeta ligniaria NRRL 30616 TaxID=1408157 RepID=A0A1J7IZJ4_9PEZI|nr:hypothetical protein CONLIGDRAFT_276364 [Coniochaeta ligniaria NRRL 30616]
MCYGEAETRRRSETEIRVAGLQSGHCHVNSYDSDSVLELEHAEAQRTFAKNSSEGTRSSNAVCSISRGGDMTFAKQMRQCEPKRPARSAVAAAELVSVRLTLVDLCQPPRARGRSDAGHKPRVYRRYSVTEQGTVVHFGSGLASTSSLQSTLAPTIICIVGTR